MKNILAALGIALALTFFISAKAPAQNCYGATAGGCSGGGYGFLGVRDRMAARQAARQQRAAAYASYSGGSCSGGQAGYGCNGASAGFGYNYYYSAPAPSYSCNGGSAASVITYVPTPVVVPTPTQIQVQTVTPVQVQAPAVDNDVHMNVQYRLPAPQVENGSMQVPAASPPAVAQPCTPVPAGTYQPSKTYIYYRQEKKFIK